MLKENSGVSLVQLSLSRAKVEPFIKGRTPGIRLVTRNVAGLALTFRVLRCPCERGYMNVQTTLCGGFSLNKSFTMSQHKANTALLNSLICPLSAILLQLWHVASLSPYFTVSTSVPLKSQGILSSIHFTLPRVRKVIVHSLYWPHMASLCISRVRFYSEYIMALPIPTMCSWRLTALTLIVISLISQPTLHSPFPTYIAI